MRVKVKLPNGEIIERSPKAKVLGNFCQLYIRYKNNYYLIGDGDEYMRGLPEYFDLDLSRKE